MNTGNQQYKEMPQKPTTSSNNPSSDDPMFDNPLSSRVIPFKVVNMIDKIYLLKLTKLSVRVLLCSFKQSKRSSFRILPREIIDKLIETLLIISIVEFNSFIQPTIPRSHSTFTFKPIRRMDTVEFLDFPQERLDDTSKFLFLTTEIHPDLKRFNRKYLQFGVLLGKRKWSPEEQQIKSYILDICIEAKQYSSHAGIRIGMIAALDGLFDALEALVLSGGSVKE